MTVFAFIPIGLLLGPSFKNKGVAGAFDRGYFFYRYRNTPFILNWDLLSSMTSSIILWVA